MPDYKKGKVYEIVCRITGEKYIGSTVESLARRLAQHRCLSDNKSRSRQIIERGDYYINLLEECSCENREQLLKKEREWYDKSGGCVNKNRPYTTEEENKQMHIDCSKNWQYNNKEKYKKYRDEYEKEYRLNNKDKINEKQREKITCECGIITDYGNLSQHRASARHIRLLANKNIPVI